jgi:hypothetical protein
MSEQITLSITELQSNQIVDNSQINIPKRVFIIPYRNRIQQKFFFQKHMDFILENETDYEIYFSHQCDARSFNRGAVKNIGFLAVKQKYPEHYKDITFIFNDVDTLPFHKIFDYQTTHGIIKHYYGFKYTLGGIVVMKGSDFELLNGFPNFWGWGNEDNCLQKRVEMFGLTIDRSVFYPIGSPQILQLFDGMSRLISKRDPWRMKHDNGVDGLKTIHNLNFTIDEKSLNPNDNIFIVDNPRTFIINITTFLTGLKYEEDDYYSYDLREPPRKIIHPDKIKKTNKTYATTDDWTNIPYYPTIKERQEQQRLQPSTSVPNLQNQYQYVQNQQVYIQRPVTSHNYPHHAHTYSHHQNQQPQQHRHNKQAPHIFSPEYANYVGAKPRAQPSAKIGLGGVKK